ncbi:MAG TPA: hypothetical protein VKT17_06295, partial [Acidobacteriota bacterium]|nr:hypothetical protein [Acidobacteriota bacterium]
MRHMNTRNIRAAALVTAIAFVLALPAAAQAPAAKPAGTPPPPLPRVFLDWPGGDIEFLKAEIPFVEFVPALEAAQIRVAVVPQGPTPEGLAIEFTGFKDFQGQDNKLTYAPAPGEKPEDVHKGVAGLIKIGLLRYAAKTPAAKDLSVRFLDQAKPTSVNDPWNFWVFSLSANAFLMGETQYRSGSYYGSFSANRTTPRFKIRTSVYGNLSTYWFDLGDGSVYTSRTHGSGFSGLIVKSLG